MKNEDWLIAFLIISKLLLHFLTNTNYELQRDSFLYYALGQHLDWGYTSVPPMIALISRFAVFLFGENTFALRFFPAIIGGVSVYIIAKMVKELKGGIWAIILACLAFILSPAFLRSNTLFQPVTFNQFFWLLSGYLILRLINTRNEKIWLSLFLVFGLAFLNKYSISFVIVSFLVALALTPYRMLFQSRYFFMGGFIAVVIIFPNLVWQYNHSWPLLHHMAELQKYQFVHVSLIGFIIDQFVMNLPAVFIWLTGLVIILFRKNEKQYRIFGLLYVFTLLILIILHGKSYYTLGLYPILFAFGAYAIEKYFRNTFRWLILIFMVIIAIPMMPYGLPILSMEKMAEYSKNSAPFTNRWEDGEIHKLPQDYADMMCWKETAGLVIDAYQSLPDSSQQNCAIYAEEYCIAGAIMFHGKKYELPEPVSFSDNFLLWAPDSLNISTLIYVNDELGDLDWLFRQKTIQGEINNPLFRENGTKVVVATSPTAKFADFYAKKVKELKDQFRK